MKPMAHLNIGYKGEGMGKGKRGTDKKANNYEKI